MNNRYLYRAKRTDNGEWVEGYYLFCPIQADNKPSVENFIYKHWIVTHNGNPFKVDSSTICQCTGLKDKNGKLIWENDIVKGKYYDNGKSHRHIGQVKYIYEAYKAVGVKQYTGYHAHLDGSYEVIGNIFDNPELLEK